MDAKSRLDENGQPTPEATEDEKTLQARYPGYVGIDDDYVHAGSEALERWWDKKFGIRIHWSIYSITAHGNESWPLTRLERFLPEGNKATFRSQYEKLYTSWYPIGFNADEWCDLFVRAGLTFFTFTTKHHDGFSMYDTKTRVTRRRVHVGPDAGRIVECDMAYSIMETPFGRDVVKELVDAGRARGLGISLYFSHVDWFDSDFRIDERNYQKDKDYTPENDPEGFKRLLARHREQIRELCTNYGPLDQLSLDIRFPDNGRKHGLRDEMIETVKMARRLQPQMLMRNRGIEEYGDYCTPERRVPVDFYDPATTQRLPWKVIYPGGNHFSYNWGDNYKPASWLIDNLVDITAKGGNFQVGYGPGPDGRWDEEVVMRLEETGEWLKVNGEGIFSTRPWKTFREGPHIRFTRSKGNKYVYVFLLKWPEAPFDTGQIRFTSVRAKSGSPITMLGLDHHFLYKQDDKALRIEIPEWLNDPDKRPCDHTWTFKLEAECTQIP